VRAAAVAAAPDDAFYAEPLFDLLLIRAGDYRGALAVAETIHALQPDNGAGHARLGYAHMGLGEYAAAELDLREAVTIDPLIAMAHSALGYTLQHQGKLDEAIKEFEAAIALAPSDTDTHLRLGRVYYQQRRYRDVVGVLTRAIRLGNEDARLYATLCSAYYELSAMAAYEACVPRLLARYTGGIIGLPSIPEAMRTRGLPLLIR